MKTIEALYNEVLENDGLKKSFAEAVTGNKLAEFLKENGCEATPEEIQLFLQEKQAKEGAVSDAELDSVSGGCNCSEMVISIATVGISCASMAIVSAVEGESTGSEGRILCGLDGTL